jgi:hypothetical protein
MSDPCRITSRLITRATSGRSRFPAPLGARNHGDQFGDLDLRRDVHLVARTEGAQVVFRPIGCFSSLSAPFPSPQTRPTVGGLNPPSRGYRGKA